MFNLVNTYDSNNMSLDTHTKGTRGMGAAPKWELGAGATQALAGPCPHPPAPDFQLALSALRN